MTVIARYGDVDAALAVHNETLALQLAHRSVRKFTAQPVTDEQLSALVAAAQSAATSSNLQPWSVIAIRDPQRKARLAVLANNQEFINEAPLFLVRVADLGRARRLAQRSGAALDGADYLETTIIGFVDTALAAQNAVVAAESLGLGTVFVGAIRNHPEEVAAELDCHPTPRPPSASRWVHPTRRRTPGSNRGCPATRCCTVSSTTLRRRIRRRRLRRTACGVQQPLRPVGQLE